MNIPKTKKDDVTEVLHDTEVNDPYRWLEDIKSDTVKEWVRVQSTYTESILKELPYREELRKDFTDLTRTDIVGIPHSRNGLYFFMKRKVDEDLFVLYVKKGINGDARVLVDPNILSKEKGSVVNLKRFSISQDGSLITYLLSENANDQSNLYVMDVRSGNNSDTLTEGNLYPTIGSWNGNDGFWYTRRKREVPKGEEKFHKRVFYHKLGTSFQDDEIIFGENLPKEDFPRATISRDNKYLTVSVYILSEMHRRSELYIKNLSNNEGKFVPVIKDIKGKMDTIFETQVYKDSIYIMHNYNTPNYKVDRVSIDTVGKGIASWETIIPESHTKVIEDFIIRRDKLFLLTLENVCSSLSEFSIHGEFVRDVYTSELGTLSGVIAEYDGSEGFFRFSSLTHSPTIFRIDFDTNKITEYERIYAHIDTSLMVSKQVWYTAKDGTKIPMFLVYHKDTKMNGANPTVLYGYGGFGISVLPAFRKNIIPFIMRGGVYAIANIRGGGEFGEKWHSDGIKNKKQTVFDDFICAAEWLIKEKYTNTHKLAIYGGSNGGLLVGAVSNQRPELFKAVLMAVPVTDMLRFHLFHGGRLWITDYGCADDAEMFPYLLKYSPYHNVKKGVMYPSVYIETSEEDDRVHAGHAFKMTAKLQEISTDERPVLLRVEKNAGHGGSIDVSRIIESLVDKWSFIFWQLGMDD